MYIRICTVLYSTYSVHYGHFVLRTSYANAKLERFLVCMYRQFSCSSYQVKIPQTQIPYYEDKYTAGNYHSTSYSITLSHLMLWCSFGHSPKNKPTITLDPWIRKSVFRCLRMLLQSAKLCV
jgi:hypothetical protein